MTLADHPTTTPPPATYGAVLGGRHVVRLLGGTLTGRLPNGMVPVSVVLWITSAGGPLAFAGLLAALYGLASGLSQPVKGRLMDRYGQTRVSAPAALLNSGCLLALPVIGAGGHPVAVTAVVGFAGLFTPPLEAGLRALWPAVLPDLGRRRVVQALDTGSQGLLYIVGPLLASWLATAYGPDIALTATAALGLVGTAVVLTAAPSRTWRPVPASGATGGGRLMNSGLVLLFTALSGTGFALGAMNVWAAGMATTHGMAMLSGMLPAAFSSGSFLGGLIYARRAWPGTTTSQLITTAGLFVLGWIPLLAQPGAHAAIALTVVPGLFLTLIITNGFHTVDTLAPASRTTEAYAWLILSVGTGQAAGTALAGALAERPYVLAALPAAGAATSLAILVLARRKLGPGRRLGRHRRSRHHQPHHSNLPAFEGDSLMAIRTEWQIVHSCGHEVTRDLSDRPADKRAGFARWLGGRDCTDCWKASRDSDSAAKEVWLAAKRAEEQQAALEWATQFDMPPLEGPERALAWGERSRFQLVTAAYTALVTEGGTWDEADWAALEEKIRTVTRAGWWIDQRDAEGTDLPELLDAATAEDRGTENPFR
ncbi:MFS transporter [Streptomyces antarcticus]|uniref:MFS transporter n=1 Tax=Streptomyces antarcticus TaxID=2996458 RepID=UPI00226F568C|nr:MULTISPECIES: MFS transporter [unclassified Streptomyces]MCY0940244.1 MFS transporter [Streptomyces sp. H34-AA3]MCZ4080891.1 MFS transporter [Streptomyces sp. H34-S5]